MAQAVNRRLFGDAAFSQSQLKGALHTAGIAGFAHGKRRLPFGWSAGEKPCRMPMGCPEATEGGQKRFWQRNIAVFAAFTLPYMKPHSVAINITDLQPYRFAQTEAASIDSG